MSKNRKSHTGQDVAFMDTSAAGCVASGVDHNTPDQWNTADAQRLNRDISDLFEFRMNYPINFEDQKQLSAAVGLVKQHSWELADYQGVSNGK